MIYTKVSTMKCPNCQTENPPGAKFCNECGHRLIPSFEKPEASALVEEKLDRIQKYPPKGLVGKILSQREKIEGELRHVTIMFCDMKGFTPLSAKIGPERTFSLMDKIFEIIIRRVNEYEGTVNELRGDGALIFFGAPIALEEAPIKALHCALAIQKEIASFNATTSAQNDIPPILFRIGINSGLVVVGFVGKELHAQFTAQGDTVNVAARMEAIAKPGTIYVTEETYKATKSMFRFENLGDIKVKGKERPLRVYQLVSAKSDTCRPRLGDERILYSEMVGRDEELARLETQVMKAANGQGSIVNIIGEAGIGKSRLMAELKKRDVMRSITLLEGRATSIGRHMSFHPIIDLLKNWARINESDTGTAAFRKLETAVRRVSPQQIDEVLPFLATLMRMRLSGRYAERIKGIEGEALEKLIMKNVRDLLLVSTELNPLVIAAEDLHWADTSSIDIMESLFGLIERQRILFINIFRPGFKETGNRIIETIRERFPSHYVEINLQPLNRQMSETLLNNMLKIKGFQHAFIDQIIERSGGNPFFIEEVIRSLVEEGAVVAEGEAFRVTDKISNTVVPRTINDVLMTRIDHLEETTRNLLKMAAVIGRSFFHRILSEVADSVDNIDERLSYLTKIHILRRGQRKGEVEYLFKHVLAQEVAYNSILPHKRRGLHLKVADAIEKVFAERLHEFYGMLAFHYSKAEDIEKAEDYLLKAGEDALKSSASNEAIHYYQDALFLYLKQQDTLPDHEKVAMIERNIALALYNKGRYEEALKYFERALNYFWGALPQNPFSAAFTFFSGFLHFLVSLYLPFLKFRKPPTLKDNQATDLFFKKLKALAILNPKQFFMQSVYFNRKVTEFDLTQIESGPGMLVAASSLFSFTGISFRLSSKILSFVDNRFSLDDIKSSTVYDFCATIHHYFEGNWDRITDCDENLINRNLSIGDIYFAAQHLYWHTCPKLCQGDFKATELAIERLEDLFEVYQNEFPMLLKFLLNSSLLMECRKLDAALIEIEQGMEFGKKLSQGSILIEMNSRKAHIYALMEDLDEAEKALRSADVVRSEIDTVPWQLTDFFRSQFEIDLRHLRESLRKGAKTPSHIYRRKAERSGRKLLKVAKKVALIRTESYRLMGLYFWLTQNQQKALKWWRRSIDEGERLGAGPELSRTYFEVGKHLLESGSKYDMLNDLKADEWLEKARALFEEMGLQYDLDNLDKIAKA